MTYVDKLYSDIIFPVFQKSLHPHAFLLLAALAAGASERLAPSIIETLEKGDHRNVKEKLSSRHRSEHAATGEPDQ